MKTTYQKKKSQTPKPRILPNLQQTDSLVKPLDYPKFNFNSVTYLQYILCPCPVTSWLPVIQALLLLLEK